MKRADLLKWSAAANAQPPVKVTSEKAPLLRMLSIPTVDHDPEKWRLHNLWVRYERQFETSDDLTDDETVEVLKGFGLDFTDERGQPLRCTKLFSRVAEFAARGIKGKLPDPGAIQLVKFEDSLTKERDAYLANKRKLIRQS